MQLWARMGEQWAVPFGSISIPFLLHIHAPAPDAFSIKEKGLTDTYFSRAYSFYHHYCDILRLFA
jgi:hypothetical protein